MALDAKARRERASKAGQAANSASSYVQRICKMVDQLTPADFDALRAIVGPAEYADGVRAGARMVLDEFDRVTTVLEAMA